MSINFYGLKIKLPYAGAKMNFKKVNNELIFISFSFQSVTKVDATYVVKPW